MKLATFFMGVFGTLLLILGLAHLVLRPEIATIFGTFLLTVGLCLALWPIVEEVDKK